jgi:trehalose 6-phosphate synthase
MSRLVVVSNRLPLGRPTGAGGELELPAGGLVSALADALQRRPESLWVGWDSRAAPGTISRFRARGVEFLGLALDKREIERYYAGFCNGALWPLLHSFQGRVRFDPGDLEAYRAVQRRFAELLAGELAPDDVVWVHDYHLFGVGSELRARRFPGAIGFFLHTPFPPPDLWEILPDARGLLDAMASYDLVGFHTRGWRRNYLDAVHRLAGARVEGATVELAGRRQRVGLFPVGIDPEGFAPSEAVLRRPKGASPLANLAGGRRVILGVDRLDYTKGMAERFQAFRAFVERHPEWRRRVTMVQIASPSRATLPFYLRERRELEELVGHLNGALGEIDWTPIRYLYRTFPRDTLARIYRNADVGLITPLRDGMNLVAKEYVAAQRPDEPGVLILSRFAGAAEELTDALLVNPFLAEETGDAIAAALEMPLDERRRRHAALLGRVRRDTAERWAAGFVSALSTERSLATAS